MTACSNENKQGNNNGDKNGDAESQPKKTILFFGNSLTAGYGLENPEEAFPAVIQQKIRKKLFQQ